MFKKKSKTMINSYTLRAARLEDVPCLRQLEQGVVEAERPFNPTINESDVQYYELEELIGDLDANVQVVEHEGRIIGTGYGKIRQAKPYFSYRSYLYLGFMYVLPDYRGQGINRLVMEALIHWGKSRGVGECRLDVYAANDAALRAYKKLGFKELLVEMRLEV